MSSLPSLVSTLIIVAAAQAGADGRAVLHPSSQTSCTRHMVLKFSDWLIASSYLNMSEPRGILRNKDEKRERRELTEELDRKEVIRNTMLNAKLASESSKGEEIRAKIAQARKLGSGENGAEDNGNNEHLKWDEINLYKTEQEKSATMKIDEPKTPYTGGFNPNGEYYQEDDIDIPAFNLGKSELEKQSLPQDSLNGGLIYVDPDQKFDEEEPKDDEKEQLTAEERHKRFEEKRKQHYHMKALPLKQGVQLDEE